MAKIRKIKIIPQIKTKTSFFQIIEFRSFCSKPLSLASIPCLVFDDSKKPCGSNIGVNSGRNNVSIFKSQFGWFVPQAMEPDSDTVIIDGILYGLFWRQQKKMLESLKASQMPTFFYSKLSFMNNVVIESLNFFQTSERRNAIGVKIVLKQVKTTLGWKNLLLAGMIDNVANLLIYGAQGKNINLSGMFFRDPLTRSLTKSSTELSKLYTGYYTLLDEQKRNRKIISSHFNYPSDFNLIKVITDPNTLTVKYKFTSERRNANDINYEWVKGKIASVFITIPSGGTGKISLLIEDKNRKHPTQTFYKTLFLNAKAEDEITSFPFGSSVKIISVENTTARVETP